jgi:hypothetical protein
VLCLLQPPDYPYCLHHADIAISVYDRPRPLPGPGTHSAGVVCIRLLLLPALPRRASWYSMAFLEGCLCLR